MKYKKEIFIFIVVMLLLAGFNYFLEQLTHDEVWLYGFSYNMSRGLIPYRDFNMVVTPLYPFLMGMIIKIFGNHLFLLTIFNSIIAATIFLIIYRRIGWKSIMFFPVLIFIMTIPGYNILSLCLLFIFLELYDSKLHMKLTKQTVGGLLLIVSFLMAEDKKSSYWVFYQYVFFFYYI